MAGELIKRDIVGHAVQQREDGYVNATQLCQAAGKRLNNYIRSKEACEFLDALSTETRISASVLIEVKKGGNNRADRGNQSEQGTWVHPRIAIDLARWCSPKFAVVVNGWVHEILTKGQASVHPSASPINARELMLEFAPLIASIAKSVCESVIADRVGNWQPSGPLVTIRDRCLCLGWHDANPKESEEIRRRVQQQLSMHRKAPPMVMSGGNALHFDGSQLPELDEAILTVWRSTAAS